MFIILRFYVVDIAGNIKRKSNRQLLSSLPVNLSLIILHGWRSGLMGNLKPCYLSQDLCCALLMLITRKYIVAVHHTQPFGFTFLLLSLHLTGCGNKMQWVPYEHCLWTEYTWQFEGKCYCMCLLYQAAGKSNLVYLYLSKVWAGTKVFYHSTQAERFGSLFCQASWCRLSSKLMITTDRHTECNWDFFHNCL